MFGLFGSEPKRLTKSQRLAKKKRKVKAAVNTVRKSGLVVIKKGTLNKIKRKPKKRSYSRWS